MDGALMDLEMLSCSVGLQAYTFASSRCPREGGRYKRKMPARLEQKKWLAGSPSRPTKRSSHFEMKRLLLNFGGL